MGHIVALDAEGRLILDIIPILTNESGHIAEAPAQALSYLVRWEEREDEKRN